LKNKKELAEITKEIMGNNINSNQSERKKRRLIENIEEESDSNGDHEINKTFIEKRFVTRERTHSLMQQYGTPNIYICGKVNFEWVRKGEENDINIIRREFYRKVTLLIENLKADNYFEGKKVRYIIYSAEKVPSLHNQLPKLLMLVKLDDTTVNVINFIDRHIKAEVPSKENYKDLSDSTYNNFNLMFSEKMIHRCSKHCQDDKGLCVNEYDRKELVPTTTISENGNVNYRRRSNQDLAVVPYHEKSLLDWKGFLTMQYIAPRENPEYIVEYLLLTKNVTVIERNIDN